MLHFPGGNGLINATENYMKVGSYKELHVNSLKANLNNFYDIDFKRRAAR